jgi:HEPN domain-containing protein
MGLPRTAEAKRFYRAAKQRFQEAEVLLNAGMNTGAVYLAGYTVECLLKALLLEGAAPGLRKQLLDEFRGSRAHSIEWLLVLYRQHVRANIPRDVSRHLRQVSSWSTELRYATVLEEQGDADAFVESVLAIIRWADGRM